MHVDKISLIVQETGNFFSKIAWEHRVQYIPTGRFLLIRGGMTVEGDQDTWDTVQESF